jgi:probable rRNA maturation factor
VTNKFDIPITDEQSSLELDGPFIRRAVELVLSDAGKTTASVSVAVVDDEQIHELNKTHLQHDYATDVLSFVFENTDQTTDGEIVVSAEMAVTMATRFNAKPHDELILYVVHGALHLVGYDDKDDASRDAMLAQERDTLARLGLAAPAERDTPVGFIVPDQGSSS